MPRLKMDDDDFNAAELDDAEYEEGPKRYTGPQPPSGTILTGSIKKAWWTVAKDNVSRQMIVIFEADSDTDYEGLGVFEYLTFNTKSKWRWAPFLDNFGLTVNDLKKNLYVDSEDDNMGAPIQRITKNWVVGEDSTACRILTKRDRDQNGDWRTNVDVWLPYEDEDDEDDDEEEEQPPPTRRVKAPAAKTAASSKTGAAKRRRPEPEPAEEDIEEEDDDLEEEEDGEEIEEEEDQEEEAPPKRPAKPAASAKPTTGRARSAKPVAATPGRRTAVSGRVSSKPAGRRKAAAADDDDPPF